MYMHMYTEPLQKAHARTHNRQTISRRTILILYTPHLHTYMYIHVPSKYSHTFTCRGTLYVHVYMNMYMYILTPSIPSLSKLSTNSYHIKGRLPLMDKASEDIDRGLPIHTHSLGAGHSQPIFQLGLTRTPRIQGRA